MKEEWSTIEEFPMYEVSTLGQVRSHYTNKILKPTRSNKQSKGKYRFVNLVKNHKMYRRSIHRLVAIAFIPNPNNYPMINHKDENPSNNCIDNLEWCTAKYNANYGTGVERQKLARRKHRLPGTIPYTIK